MKSPPRSRADSAKPWGRGHCSLPVLSDQAGDHPASAGPSARRMRGFEQACLPTMASVFARGFALAHSPWRRHH